MDDTDLTISLILSGNSRMSYQELSGMLNLSVNSVHKRVKKLVESGIIRKFATKLNLPFSNVLIYGTCSTNDMEKAYIKLGQHVNIYNVTISSDNYLIIHAQLEKIQDLDSLVSFVRKTAKMTEPTIGLHTISNSDMNHDFFHFKGPEEDEFLPEISNSSIDYLIVDSIKDNSRKTITEISDEIGVSSKTVRRRLNRIIEKNLIHCTLEFFPDRSGDITANMILKIKPEAGDSKEKIVEKLKEEFGIKIVYHWTFSNLPNEMIVLIFTHSMRELQEIEKFLSKFIDTVESHRIIIGYKGDIFDSLSERYLDKKIKEIKEKSK